VTALHQIAAYKRVAKPAINAIKVVAFLLEELEEHALNQIIWESVMI
jgi:hypothetical protein